MPLPANGTNNLTAEPQLASASHLSANSPCIGKGSYPFVSGLDIDGEQWANPPSIGCDEYWSGWVTGALSPVIMVSYTHVVVGFAVDFQAVIGGPVLGRLEKLMTMTSSSLSSRRMRVTRFASSELCSQTTRSLRNAGY
jgi:hypothetical protein